MTNINRNDVREKLRVHAGGLNIHDDHLDVAALAKSFLHSGAADAYFDFGDPDPYAAEYSELVHGLAEIEDDINVAYADDPYVSANMRDKNIPTAYAAVSADINSYVADALRTAVTDLCGVDPANHPEKIIFDA